MLQCVCDWDDRDKKFTEIEAVVRRQIKVRDNKSVWVSWRFKLTGFDI